MIIGATGLVGRQLTLQLLEDDSFAEVRSFGRSSTGLSHPRLTEIKTDFDHLGKTADAIQGDVLFSCMGTTRSDAGSKEAQYKVDYSYQYHFARIAAGNGVKDYVLISSPGADPDSMFFYSRIKGELERDIKQLPFNRHIIIQPSILRGERVKSRIGERLTARIIDGLSKVIPPLRKYHSIHASEVARSMIRYYKDPSASGVYSLTDLF